MFAVKSLSSYPTFGVDPVTATQRALSLWAENYRTASEFGLWWTEKCLRTPTYFTAWAITRTVGATPSPVDAPAPVAANVIRIADVIEAATTAAIAPAEVAAVVLETVQTEILAETPPPALEAVVETAEAAIEAAPEVVEAAAEAMVAVNDDLTRLVGIGPKLAAALAERGVTAYAQIAAWTQDDLAEVDKALDLKGRAVRDAWVAQAKRFAADS